MSATTFILFVYLATFSASSGMTITSAEFHTRDACEAAGAEVTRRWASFYTQARHYCAPNPKVSP